MICYKDKTFCASPGCTGECGRGITRREIQEAVQLGLPIAWADFCGPEEIKKIQTVTKIIQV